MIDKLVRHGLLYQPCHLILVTVLIILVMPQIAISQPAASQVVEPAASTPKPVGADSSSSKPPLQGSIEHSETLPGLSERLKPGSKYKDELLLELGTEANNDWYWIPKWYAGKRHAEEALILFRHDFNTGISSTPMQRQLERQDSVSGYQLDREGDIWDLKKTRFIQHIDSGAALAVLYVKNMTPLAISNSQLVLKYDELSITYSKRDHKILEVVQQEQINKLAPIQPGLLRADISVKSFGWDGQPQRCEQSVMFSNIVEAFHPIDYLDDKDLRPMFRDYLIAHHLENLVPEAVKN
jgi:hypothetical protein